MRIARLRALSACLALGIAGVACVGKGAGSETEGRNINPAIGRNVTFYAEKDRRAVSFSGKDMDGKPIRSADLRGSVALVNFWASWCAPCRTEQPVLEKVWREYQQRKVKVTFIGIDIRDSRASARAFVDEYDVSYPSIFNQDAGLGGTFRVTTPPTTFVLDVRGRIAARIIGATASPAELRAVIDEVLGA